VALALTEIAGEDVPAQWRGYQLNWRVAQSRRSGPARFSNLAPAERGPIHAPHVSLHFVT